MVHGNHRPLTWILVVLCMAALGNDALYAASPNKYRDSVVTFYDNVLRHGRDDYGKKTPLFADGVDLRTKRAVVASNGAITCNFIFQQYLLRGLEGLSSVTGEEKYRRAAGEATEYVLDNLVNPRSGLIYWGGHVYWDLKADGPRFDPHDSHELKHDFPYYEFLYEVNPQATERFIESFWTAHVDLEDPWMMFGRHASMDRPGPRAKVKPGALAFTLSAADLFYAAGFLYSKTQDPLWRDRAVGLAERFARLKDPKTGLAPAILDAHDPAFDRQTHRLSLGHLGVTVRNLLIDYGRRSDSYALSQLHLAEILPEEAAEKFRTWALDDLLAYGSYCYDPQRREFHEMRRTDTGERILFSQTRWYPTNPRGHYIMPQRFYGNKGLPLLFLAYARGYRLTKDARVKQTAEKCLDILDMKRGGAIALSGVSDEYLKSDFAGCLIQGLLDLSETDEDVWYLEAARRLADDALDRFFDGEFFVDWPHEFRYSRVNQGLPLALLRLYAVLSKKNVALPQDVGGYGMEGFRPNIISGIDGDLPLLYMWANHHVDIRGHNVSARIGDYFPHDGQADGLFNYPGVWRLGSSHYPANVLDSRKGMVFEPLWRALPAELRKPNGEEAEIEHWQYQSGSTKGPYFGVRMKYRIGAPDSLDWTLEITPLEENYGNLSLRGMAYLNAKASPEITFSAPDGLAHLQVAASGETIVKPRTDTAGAGPRYRHPLFYSRIEDVILVFMFKPGAPIDLLAAGPSQEDPGGLRGFVWHIADAKKDQVYKLDLRVKVLPVSRGDEVLADYQQWSR